MTISKRTRERAAEVVFEHDDEISNRGPLIDRILAIPDDEQEQAIRAAACEQAAQLTEGDRAVVLYADGLPDAIRALAPMPPGYVAVRVEDLDGALHALETEGVGGGPGYDRLRAALPEDPNG